MLGPRNLEEAEIYAIEALLADTQYCIQSVMGQKRISRSELAKRLGCSPANVTQMLSEHSNLTLESVARIFYALEDGVMVKSEYLERRRAKVLAEALHATWDRTQKNANEAFAHPQKEGVDTAAGQSSFRLSQEWLPQAGQLDGVLGGEESLHDYERAA